MPRENLFREQTLANKSSDEEIASVPLSFSFFFPLFLSLDLFLKFVYVCTKYIQCN